MDLICRKLPESLSSVEIYPVCDLHLGDVLADVSGFKQFVQFILQQPNRYVVCLGDIINNSITSSVGDTYLDNLSPMQQKKEAKKLLEPLKGRILFMTGGNHEYRTAKDVNLDITEDLADYLEAPYCPEEGMVKLSFGSKRNGKPRVYTIYGTHGSFGGRKPGSVLNRAEEIGLNIIADVYLFGHAHRSIGYRNLLRIPDLYNNNIREMEQVIVLAPSWLKYGGYAARKQMQPQPRGYVWVTLCADGQKIGMSI